VAFHATASTTPPTFPSLGTNVTQAAWAAAGFVTGGKVDDVGNIFDLDEDTVEPSWLKEWVTIRPPRGNAPSSMILMSHRVEPFTVKLYGPNSVDADVGNLDSNATTTANVWTPTSTTTNRTCCIEVEKILMFVFPICIVDVDMGHVGFAGDDSVIRPEITVTPLRHSTYTTGGYIRFYV
jgi:hypothetical protein